MKDSDRNQDASIFSTLQQLPLLKGASVARLNELVGRFRLHFFKAASGELIVEPGSPCASMLFVLSGSVRLTVSSPDALFSVGQTLSAPQVIAPDHLFGLLTSYPCRVEAIGPVGLMEISKEDFRRILALDQVFFFNYLNMVCANSQRASRGLFAVAAGSPLDRLNYWITTLTQPGATDIEIRSSARDLHTLLGLSASAMRTAIDRLSPSASAPDPRTLLLSVRPS